MAVPARKRKRRLGKGLEGLLSKRVEITLPESTDSSPAVQQQTPENASYPGSHTPSGNFSDTNQGISSQSVDRGGLVYLNVQNIVPNPRQPRQVFDDDGLAALANSIETAGLMQPVVVRQMDNSNTYELVAGERRWRAAQIASLQQIPALIRDLDDRTSAEWSLIENLQREDLNPIDRAEAFDRLVVDFNVTQQEIATQLGIDRSSVTNFLRLNDLEASIKDAVRDGRLTMGHAKVLLGIPDLSTSKAIARKCATQQWSVRELERQLKRISEKDISKKNEDPDARTMYMENLAGQLGEHLGTKVHISLGKKKGSGKLTLTFYSNEQFEGILDTLGFKPSS